MSEFQVTETKIKESRECREVTVSNNSQQIVSVTAQFQDLKHSLDFYAVCSIDQGLEISCVKNFIAGDS